MYVLVYRARPEDVWTPYRCPSGRFRFDAYEACHKARNLVTLGYAEAEVHPIGAEGVFARFDRSETGELRQEDGVAL